MRKWILNSPIQSEDNPPAGKLSWFWDEGNAKIMHPHIRLAMPVLENVGSCTHWMPYTEGDAKPEPPNVHSKD